MKHIEDNLDMTVAQLIPKIQDRLLRESTYFGIPAIKNPMDFWVYRELIVETQPDVVLEIGNYAGGSLLALAHICDNLGFCRVIGVDNRHDRLDPRVADHPGVTLVTGRATEVFDQVRGLIKPDETVMIIEDSSHTYQNTLAVLRTYAPLVKVGDYFIVEDSLCHHGLDAGPNPGPYEALTDFLAENADFEADRKRESFHITWNPNGFLRRIR